MNKVNVDEHLLVLTVERIVAAYPKMSEAEKNSLAKWERAHLERGEKGTTDWPGWTEVLARLSH